jgi:hypothetical protein
MGITKIRKFELISKEGNSPLSLSQKLEPKTQFLRNFFPKTVVGSNF